MVDVHVMVQINHSELYAHANGATLSTSLSKINQDWTKHIILQFP